MAQFIEIVRFLTTNGVIDDDVSGLIGLLEWHVSRLISYIMFVTSRRVDLSINSIVLFKCVSYECKLRDRK